MKINIQNLDRDLVEYDADLDGSFINQEIIEYYPEKIKVHVVLDKFGKDYRVDIDLETRAHYICDRCLGNYKEHFQSSQRHLFHIGEIEDPENDEIVQIPANATEIDLSPFLSEMILLNHPIKMVCSEDCKGICPNCGADLNNEECKCQSESVDPRWDELKKFIK